MSRNLVTVTRKTSIQTAIQLMKDHSIRHLPVLDAGEFVGFVTESDLRGVIIPSMIEEISINDVMIANPITVAPQDTVEKAAILLYRHKIGGLPVIDGGRLVGIITVADVLESFIQFMGVLESSSRLDVLLKAAPGSLADAVRLIAQAGGHIISIGVTTEKEHPGVHAFRLRKMDLTSLIAQLDQAGHKVVGWED